MNYTTKKRTVLLFWVFAGVFLIMAGHLLYIQIFVGPRLSQSAIAQQTQQVALEVPLRGQILDRNLKPLVSYKNVWRVAVFLPVVVDRERAALALASLLNRDYFDILAFFKDNSVMLPWDLEYQQAEEIKRLALPGVVVLQTNVRERKQNLASHILGYLGIRNGPEDWTGLTGIENRYNQDLQGKSPKSAARVYLDAKGRFIAGMGYWIEEGLADKNRKNVVLTIDRDIQLVSEQAMDRAGVKNGAAVVMDRTTGDILAMVSRPDYQLNHEPSFEIGTTTLTITKDSSFMNKSLSFFQPGSVFKVVLAAAALEENMISLEDTFFCVGASDSLVRCYKEEGHGEISFAEALAVSCNPTFARVGLKIGADKLIEYAKKFGFSNGDIIGYQEVDKTKEMLQIGERYNLVNASLGQWPVVANAVQVTAMMAAIANKGIYQQPRLVQKILNDDGTIAANFELKGYRAVSKSTAAAVQAMLAMVTSVGTGQKAAVEGWGSAGKTGSAQTGANTIDAWFSGYAPAADPKYAVTVLVAEGNSGGATAAPIFHDIVQGIMNLQTGKEGV